MPHTPRTPPRRHHLISKPRRFHDYPINIPVQLTLFTGTLDSRHHTLSSVLIEGRVRLIKSANDDTPSRYVFYAKHVDFELDLSSSSGQYLDIHPV